VKQLRVCAVSLVLMLLSSSLWAQAKSYKVIVNPSNRLTSISYENVSRIFLKKTTKFPNGLSASPVDLPGNSVVREHFSLDVHGKPASAVEVYWQQLIFSGRDIPPVQKNEKGVLDFVRSNEDAIGYVAATADTSGVKVVLVTKF
jgi:ABC-type phosphate transport system substrate-binding protein